MSRSGTRGIEFDVTYLCVMSLRPRERCTARVTRQVARRALRGRSSEKVFSEIASHLWTLLVEPRSNRPVSLQVSETESDANTTFSYGHSSYPLLNTETKLFFNLKKSPWGEHHRMQMRCYRSCVKITAFPSSGRVGISRGRVRGSPFCGPASGGKSEAISYGEGRI